MSKPKFPPIPFGKDWIRRISPAWFQQLKIFCEWAADHPRGDGQTILNTGDGTLRAHIRNSGGGGGGVSFPCFQVAAIGSVLSVSAGWLSRNGEFLKVPEKTGIEAKAGILCLYSIPDAKGVWSEPEFRISEPAACAYPIAEIKVDGTAVAVTQYPVVVAVILFTKKCPIAEF